MKKFEAKMTLLLTLPVLALFGFASILSLRNIKHNFGPPYLITKHQLVVGFDSLTEKQRKKANIIGLNPRNCVLYEIEVESRQASWLENWLYGHNDSLADLNGTSCIELKSGLSLQAYNTGTYNIGGDSKFTSQSEGFYNLDSLRKADGRIEFSVPLSWTRDGHEFTRKLSKKILPANLKEGIQ